jgi:hypothetical protein
MLIRLWFLFIILFLSGCKTLDKSGERITFVGSGINDSQVKEAKTMVITNGVVELR